MVHLVDVENLAGGRMARGQAGRWLAAYATCGVVGPDDLVVVAGARSSAVHWLFDTPAGWRRVVCEDGPDAADRALLEAAEGWPWSPRMGVVVGSADHAFLPLATRVARAGGRVIHVIGHGRAGRCWEAWRRERVSLSASGSTKPGVRLAA